MKPFAPDRVLGGRIIVDASPFAFEATASYRGIELATQRWVVVREPHEHVRDTDDFLDEFRGSATELAALAGTPAPQLLHVFGRDGRLLAFVLEAIDGTAMDELLDALSRRGTALPIPVALAIAATLVDLWRLPTERGEPVELHVGIADVVVDATGRVRATPELASDRARQTVGAAVQIYAGNIAYISPEQVEGYTSSRSGMYTLGLLLYELLTNAYPFGDRDGDGMFSLLSRIRNEDVPPLARHRPAPASVAAVVARMTVRDPSARFASWGELAAELAAVRASFPPVGPAEILASLAMLPPELQPVAPPPIDLAALAGWQSLPGDDLVRMDVPARERPPRPRRIEPILDNDLVYPDASDHRPMLACGDLLVDARPVSSAEYGRFCLATGRPLASTLLAGQLDGETAVTLIDHADAVEYARWAGKRLPTAYEWSSVVAGLGAARLGVGAVWEWTTTTEHGGHVVRGGRWRNDPDHPPSEDNRSYETGPAADVGFRCVRARR